MPAALQQAVRDLLAQRAYRDLRNVAGGPPAAVARCARRFVAWKEAAPLRACKVRFVDGSYQFVGADGARVPRPTKAAPSLARPPLFALRDVAFYASIAAVAFVAGRRSK